jgi:heme oxygenase
MSGRAPVHEALRAGTRASHERVDAVFGGFDLGNEADYRRFLRAHARAFLPVEAALEAAGIGRLVDDWPQRRRSALIVADLTALGEPVPATTPMTITGDAAAWGALYVLEGSRLGGAMLARRIGDGLPRGYLGAAQSPGAWRKLLELLASSLYADDLIEAAVASAHAVFERFEAAARDE